MAKRILMLFTRYGDKNKPALLNTLYDLENDDKLNFEFYNVIVNGDSPIASKYNIITTPTIVMLDKQNEKDDYVEVKRITKTINKSKIIKLLKNINFEEENDG